MPNSFMEQIKPVGDNSWMVALGQQRQQQQDLAKMGEELSRSSVDSVAAQGRQMLRNSGYDVPEPGQAKQFNYGPDYQQGVQAQAAQPGMASPALGQVGGNEAQFYQNQGASNFDSMVKQSGIQQDQATGDYFKVVGGQKVNANEDVARMSGGLGLAVPNKLNEMDQNRRADAALGVNTPVTYQDATAKQMGIQRGTQGMEDAIQQRMTQRDNQSAQALSDQKAQKDFASTDILSKIRKHAFSSTTAPAVAFGNGMQVIDQLEAQGKVSPQQALDLRDNFVLSFNDESFTGTRGAGSGKYFQEKLKKKQQGPGVKASDYEPLNYQNAQGDFVQGSFRLPSIYKGDWRRYSNEKTDSFINDVKLSFGWDENQVKDYKDYVSGKGNYKTKGIPSSYPGLPDEIKRAGSSSVSPVPSVYGAEAAQTYQETLKKNPNDYGAAKRAADEVQAKTKGMPSPDARAGGLGNFR